MDSTPASISNPEYLVAIRATTPIITGHCTLYCFGERPAGKSSDFYLDIAAEMSPFFIGPMAIDTFLSEFLPESKLSPLQDVRPFSKGLFKHVLLSKEETGMYEPFVCSMSSVLLSCLFFLSERRS